MRELIAGEGGSALALGATSQEAAALACEGLAHAARTPSGVPVYPVDSLPDDLDVDRVRLVACEQRTAEAVSAWAAGRGVGVEAAAPVVLKAPDGVRVVAVSASSTGSGKTALVRRVVRTLRRSQVGVAVARHPIANLLLWDRFDATVVRSPGELAEGRPLEEREELAPVVGTGVPVVTGLDPQRVLAVAAREAGEGGLVVWDGGGAAEPWVAPDLHLVVVDLLRPQTLSPGRLARADAVILAKADSAPGEAAREVEASVRSEKPGVPVMLGDLLVGVSPPTALADLPVVLVEDWSSLVLGGLAAGAASVAARRFRCGVVDPRPFAVGAVAETLRAHPHIGAVIPSLGRTGAEIEDLAATVRATPGEAVLWASNADPAGVIGDETRPVIRAFGELQEVAGPSLSEVLSPVLPGGSG